MRHAPTAHGHAARSTHHPLFKSKQNSFFLVPPSTKRLSGAQLLQGVAAAATAAMSDIHYIVDRLNEPPFAMQLSLVAFDEKSPFELLEIVNSVMREISASHSANLRDETPEATANRMMDFLFKILNYKQVQHGARHGCAVPAKDRI
jgi:hypothetical protein